MPQTNLDSFVIKPEPSEYSTVNRTLHITATPLASEEAIKELKKKRFKRPEYGKLYDCAYDSDSDSATELDFSQCDDELIAKLRSIVPFLSTKGQDELLYTLSSCPLNDLKCDYVLPAHARNLPEDSVIEANLNEWHSDFIERKNEALSRGDFHMVCIPGPEALATTTKISSSQTAQWGMVVDGVREKLRGSRDWDGQITEIRICHDSAGSVTKNSECRVHGIDLSNAGTS